MFSVLYVHAHGRRHILGLYEWVHYETIYFFRWTVPLIILSVLLRKFQTQLLGVQSTVLLFHIFRICCMPSRATSLLMLTQSFNLQRAHWPFCISTGLDLSLHSVGQHQQRDTQTSSDGKAKGHKDALENLINLNFINTLWRINVLTHLSWL